MAHATINGASLYFEDSGGSGPAIIFHHGYTGSHDSWEIVAPAMASDYRCVVMDGRGAGDSEHTTGGYSIEQYADDVVGLADHLGIGRFTYVGHSMGGVIGMELGIRYPHRLEKLVLVAPAPADGIDQSTEAAKESRRHSAELYATKNRTQMISERMMLSPRPEYDRIAAATDRALSVSQGHYDDSWDALVNSRRGDALASVTTPTLVVAGAADGLLLANLRDFQRLPNATLHVFSRVGHGVHQEDPQPFIVMLRDFLEHGVVTAGTLMEASRQPAAAR